MKIFTIMLLISAASLCSLPVQARPVSYPGGWTAIGESDMDVVSLQTHYSPTARYSIGYRAEHWREEDWQFHGAQLNYLLHRENAKASQANLYFNAGTGIAYSDFEEFDGETELAGFVGLSADWEDRRFFTSYNARLTYAGDIDKFFRQNARVGVAPYVGDYGDIHTWLMLQVNHNPTGEEHFTFTPLVRMFKNEYLVEAGVSDQGEVLFNWIARF